MINWLKSFFVKEPKIGTQRIRNGKAEILTGWSFKNFTGGKFDNKTFTEEWVDLVGHRLNGTRGHCPKCGFENKLQRFKVGI